MEVGGEEVWSQKAEGGEKDGKWAVEVTEVTKSTPETKKRMDRPRAETLGAAVIMKKEGGVYSGRLDVGELFVAASRR